MPYIVVTGNDRLAIEDEIYNASVINGDSMKTNINDEFNGCDYGKRYVLDNDLILECKSYKYSYSYRPQAVLVTDGIKTVAIIGGDEYEVSLFRRN